MISTPHQITTPPPTSSNSSNKRRNIAALILTAIAIAGVLSVALVAPNALRIFMPISNKRRRGGKIRPWEIERALRRLIQGGFIERKSKGGDTVVSLTSLGHTRLKTINLQNARIKIPPRWDGRWRLVFFDIPHARGPQRDAIRKKLKELGFLQIQKSVYLHPYECYDIIKSMQNFYQIKPYFHYAIVEKIECGNKYLRHFNLKRSS